MAEAAFEGAGKDCRMERARDVSPDMLIEANGYVFVCPENLASMSGEMKEMFDRCYYPVLGQIEGRPFATLIAAGSDGHGAQAQIDRIAKGWRLRRVADPVIIVTEAQTPEAIMADKKIAEGDLAGCREIGAALHEGLRLGVF